MKKQLSITISQTSYDLLLKDRRNISAYIEDLLRSQYVEDNKTSIANNLKASLLSDKQFINTIFERVHEKEAEVRRSLDNIPEF
jgi:hypothetical protein